MKVMSHNVKQQNNGNDVPTWIMRDI